MIGKSLFFVVASLTSIAYFISFENVAVSVETEENFSESYKQAEMSNISAGVSLLTAQELNQILSGSNPTGLSIADRVALLSGTGNDGGGNSWVIKANYDDSNDIISISTIVSSTKLVRTNNNEMKTVIVKDSTVLKMKRAGSVCSYKLYSYNYDLGDTLARRGIGGHSWWLNCTYSNTKEFFRYGLIDNSDKIKLKLSQYFYKYSYFADRFHDWQAIDSLDGKGKIAIDGLDYHTEKEGAARRQFVFNSIVKIRRQSHVNEIKNDPKKNGKNINYALGDLQDKQIQSPIHKHTSIQDADQYFWQSLPQVEYEWDEPVTIDGVPYLDYNHYYKLNSAGGKIFQDLVTVNADEKLMEVKLHFNGANVTYQTREGLNSDTWSTAVTTSISDLTPNGLIFIEKGNAYVSGTINGQVTIYASQRVDESNQQLLDDYRILTPFFHINYLDGANDDPGFDNYGNNRYNPFKTDLSFNDEEIDTINHLKAKTIGGIIFIEDDITYANPDVTGKNGMVFKSDDVLGLVAERLVVVQFVPGVPGKSVWNIQAAICVPKDVGTKDFGNADPDVDSDDDWLNGTIDVRRNCTSFLFDRLFDYVYKDNNGIYSKFNLTGSLAICSPMAKPVVFGNKALATDFGWGSGYPGNVNFAISGKSRGLAMKLSYDGRFDEEALTPPFYPVLNNVFEIISFMK